MATSLKIAVAAVFSAGSASGAGAGSVPLSPRRIGQHGIGADGVQDTEIAGAERLFSPGMPPLLTEALAAEMAVVRSDKIA